MADDEVSEKAGTLNIGSIISQQLSESIKSADIVSIMQNIVSSSSNDEQNEEVRQRIKAVMDQYNNMDDEDKETMQRQMKEKLVEKLSARLQDYNLDVGPLQEAIGEAVMFQLYIAAAIVFVAFLLIVFFGYKLYKSIKEKEKKREEKKKAKMSKKKK